MEAKRSRNCNMVEIDGDKLKYELRKRGVSLIDASLQINQNKNYISSACRSSRISASAIMNLNHVYHIEKDDIIKVSTKPSLLIKSDVSKGIIDVNNNELFHIIYRATLKAMKEALNG